MFHNIFVYSPDFGGCEAIFHRMGCESPVRVKELLKSFTESPGICVWAILGGGLSF